MIDTFLLSTVAPDIFFWLILGIFGAIILIYVTLVFLVAQVLQDNSVMDIAYGPAFAVATWLTIWLTASLNPLTLALGICVSLWSARLGLRIAHKNIGQPEDQRYATWRQQWRERGHFYFLVRSYIQINLLQGLIITLVSLPMIIAMSHSISTEADRISLLTYIGLTIWLFGWLLESCADWQLDRFRARKKLGVEAAAIMTTGLFRYSRRPNYFGEALLWWGLAIAVLPLTAGWIAILSPLIITFILTRVTGPMLEAIFLEKYPMEYGVYMKKTNYFIPWFSKTPPSPSTDAQTPTI